MATSTSVKLHKLRKLIAWLSDQKGKEKEFISLYLPAETSVDGAVAALKQETAPPHASASGKANFEDNLKSILQHLKQQQQIPENGLALFAGTPNTNNPEKKTFFEEIAPPEPIAKYVCVVENHFELEPLRTMLRDQKIVGIMTLDAKEASFGVLNGERLEAAGNITSGVPGKSG